MISGKCFSERCAWVFDPRYPERPTFSYPRVSHGEWVFVNGDYLTQFRRQCPLISSKQFYIIIHNTDRPFGSFEMDVLLPICLHVYAINTTIRHPKLTTIPIGFVDRQLPYLRELNATPVERTIDIYMNFTATSNMTKRSECANIFIGNDCVTIRTGLSVDEYYNDMRRARFVLCPEGTGIDTHRVYEALLCGATPVVLRNSLSNLYETLPVCIIDSWKDTFYIPHVKPFSTDVSNYI